VFLFSDFDHQNDFRFDSTRRTEPAILPAIWTMTARHPPPRYVNTFRISFAQLLGRTSTRIVGNTGRFYWFDIELVSLPYYW
jgi:hypothetical protein